MTKLKTIFDKYTGDLKVLYKPVYRFNREGKTFSEQRIRAAG